jgi:hypothetical protein
MAMIRDALGIVRRNWQAYITINAVYYGLVIVAMFFAASHPETQTRMLEHIRKAFAGGGPLASVSSAYQGGNLWAAVLLTFVVNLFIGSLLTITIPSMIVPFSGFLMGVTRAILWGLLLSPAEPKLRGAMIPHSLTLILEGQAYILALLAAYVSGTAFLQPSSVGVETHGGGYLTGLKQTGSLYILVVLLLAVAAIYEAMEVIYVVPLFR